MFPIKKDIEINGVSVSITAEKIARQDHLAVIRVTAEANGISHSEMWTLPRNNPAYSKEQAQKDFDAHIEKVATEAASKRNAHDVADNLI
jgi:hypothetical protein